VELTFAKLEGKPGPTEEERASGRLALGDGFIYHDMEKHVEEGREDVN
jgi:hypothetical protein